MYTRGRREKIGWVLGWFCDKGRQMTAIARSGYKTLWPRHMRWILIAGEIAHVIMNCMKREHGWLGLWLVIQRLTFSALVSTNSQLEQPPMALIVRTGSHLCSNDQHSTHRHVMQHRQGVGLAFCTMTTALNTHRHIHSCRRNSPVVFTTTSGVRLVNNSRNFFAALQKNLFLLYKHTEYTTMRGVPSNETKKTAVDETFPVRQSVS